MCSLKERECTGKKREEINIRFEPWVSITNISEFVHSPTSSTSCHFTHIPHPTTGCDPTLSTVQCNLTSVDEGAIPSILSRLKIAAASRLTNIIFREICQPKLNNKLHICTTFRFWILKLLFLNSLFLYFLLAENDSRFFFLASDLVSWARLQVAGDAKGSYSGS